MAWKCEVQTWVKFITTTLSYNEKILSLSLSNNIHKIYINLWLDRIYFKNSTYFLIDITNIVWYKATSRS